MSNLKETVANAFAIAIIGTALLFAFGAPVINGLVDLIRSWGAN
jgi:hypothetical protein